jgi:phage terminase large subunit-like protein
VPITLHIVPYSFLLNNLNLFFNYFVVAVAIVQLHNVFPLIKTACKAIKQHVLDNSELYKTIKLDKKRFVIRCKDNNCKFKIRAA